MRGVVVSFSAVMLCVGCQGLETPPLYAQKTIGMDGGAIESLDGTFKIIIPPGAVLQEQQFRLERTVSAPPGAIGNTYYVRPNLGLAIPATFTYDYSETDLRDRNLDLLNIGTNLRINNRNAWTALTLDTNDQTARIVTAKSQNIGYDYGLILDDALGEDPGDSETTDTSSSSTDSSTTDTSGESESSTSDGEASTGGEEESGEPGEDSTSGTSGDEPDATSEETEGDPTDGEPACDNGRVDAGEVCLSEVISFGAPAGAAAIAVLDIDEDGNLDVVVAGTSAMRVLHGNGRGTLSNPNNYAVGSAPVALATGDFDGDGDLDVAVLHGGDDEVAIMLNDGGDLDPSPDAAALDGDGPIALLAAPLDNDSDLDVAVLNAGSSDVSLLLGDGEGSLAAAASSPVVLGAVPLAFALGDFNNDDFLDLVTVTADGLEVRAGSGQARFGTAAAATVVDETATAIAVGHFNDDANLDVAIATAEGSVYIYPGDGLGGFGGAVPYTVGDNPVAIVAADVSGDGILDLVTANAGGDGSISVLIGRQRGGVEDTLTFAAGPSPSGVAVGDFNGDGAADIVVSNAGGEVTVLLSAP